MKESWLFRAVVFLLATDAAAVFLACIRRLASQRMASSPRRELRSCIRVPIVVWDLGNGRTAFLRVQLVLIMISLYPRSLFSAAGVRFFSAALRRAELRADFGRDSAAATGDPRCGLPQLVPCSRY